MTESVLPSWESFYVIVGSSGGALIGLQFVVITLIADRRDLMSPGSIAAFVIAAAALSLLLIGIHNAWDSVTHIATSEKN